MAAVAAVAAILVALILPGCAGKVRPSTASGVALSPDQQPIPAGTGRRYRLPAVTPRVAQRLPVAGLRCSGRHRRFFAAHLELYANRLVLPVPAGIGVAPPARRSGAYVTGGACRYPIRTFEPTGVTVLDAGRSLTLGQLFAVWGQPLSRRSLAGFHGAVEAFVNGRRWRRAPAAIPLRRHSEIVLEIDGLVAPHRTYTFPPGF